MNMIGFADAATADTAGATAMRHMKCATSGKVLAAEAVAHSFPLVHPYTGHADTTGAPFAKRPGGTFLTKTYVCGWEGGGDVVEGGVQRVQCAPAKAGHLEGPSQWCLDPTTQAALLM